MTMNAVEITFIGGPKDGTVATVPADEYGYPEKRTLLLPVYNSGWPGDSPAGEFRYRIDAVPQYSGRSLWIAFPVGRTLPEAVSQILNGYVAYRKMESAERLQAERYPPVPLSNALTLFTTAADWDAIPAGAYRGIWTGYRVSFSVGSREYQTQTECGIRGTALVEVTIRHGETPLMRVIK